MNNINIVQFIKLKDPTDELHALILGLGEDSKVYLWNYNTSEWTLYGMRGNL